MAEYKFDEDSVKALIDWAKSTSFPQSVTLSDAENIVDVKRFVQANLSDIDDIILMIFIILPSRGYIG